MIEFKVGDIVIVSKEDSVYNGVFKIIGIQKGMYKLIPYNNYKCSDYAMQAFKENGEVVLFENRLRPYLVTIKKQILERNLK